LNKEFQEGFIPQRKAGDIFNRAIFRLNSKNSFTNGNFWTFVPDQNSTTRNTIIYQKSFLKERM
jgi:hypothetical protein